MANIPEPPQSGDFTSYWKFSHHQRPQGQVSRHRIEKQVAKAASTGASLGLSAGQIVTNTQALAVVSGVVAGTAVSATGIGLVAGSAALTLGGLAAGARSAYKTHKHIGALQRIQDNRNRLGCGQILQANGQPIETGNASPHLQRRCHRVIAETVLPYILSKKRSKRIRKGATAAGFGLLDGLRGLGKKAYKWGSGTLGRNRTKAATWLGFHLVCSNCALTQEIVAELYSFEEMAVMLHLDGASLVPLLADKIKST